MSGTSLGRQSDTWLYVTEALDQFVADYDVQAIAHDAFDWNPSVDRYELVVSESEFWALCAQYERPVIMDRIDTLAAIRAARRASKEAQETLRRLCLEAVDTSAAPISQIADAAQVARTTIYAWIEETK